ncbi:hypothetical protein D3C87_1654070 [compost metagenome]
MVERDGLAQLGLERLGQGLGLGIGQRRSRGDVGRGFATGGSGQLSEHGNDGVECEQAPIPRHQAQEIAHQRIDLGLLEDRLKRRRLDVAGDHGGTEIAREVVAFTNQPGDVGKAGFHLGQLVLALGEIEQRRRIRPRDLGKH